jgi:hypothetical protein
MSRRALFSLLSAAIFSFASLSADTSLQKMNQEELINSFYQGEGYPIEMVFGFPGDWTKVSTKHAKGNFRSYKISFNDSQLVPSRGFIDSNAGYLIYDVDKLITSRKEIDYITKHFKQLPVSYSFLNLNAYAGKFKHDCYQKIVFVDNLKRYAFEGGALYDTDFNNYTFEAADAFIHESWAKYLFHKAKCVHSFLQGNPAAQKVIRVFGTPDDNTTNQFYEEILPYVESGEVAIYWSLFSTQRYNFSRGQIYAIYEGVLPEGAPYPSTPEGAWAFNNDFFDTPDEIGAIPPIVRPRKDTVRWATDALIYSTKYIIETPFILYRDTSGNNEYIVGVPPDIDAFVDSIYVQ